MILIHHTVFYVYLNIIVIYHCKLYMDYFWYYSKFDFLYFFLEVISYASISHILFTQTPFTLDCLHQTFLRLYGCSIFWVWILASFIKGVPYSKISYIPSDKNKLIDANAVNPPYRWIKSFRPLIILKQEFGQELIIITLTWTQISN